VLAEFCRAEREFAGNVLAKHSLGQLASAEMERITTGIANLMGAKPQEIIFTSGATEANNLAIKGLAKAYGHVGKHILSTCLEHPSVSGTLAALQQQGYEIELLKLLPTGQIDLGHLQAAIRPSTVLVCVSMVDSELGVIQPIQEISRLLPAHCHLHVDAAQAVGKIPVNIAPSTYCFSPHKFGGICGIGVLVKRADVVLEPEIHGGTGTTIYRGGTPTLSLAAAAYKALDIAIAQMPARLATAWTLRNYLLEKLTPLLHINSSKCQDIASPYILNVSAVGIKATKMQEALDRHGVCVSVKSACSTDSAPSRPVLAISNKKNATWSWRVSFCHSTTMAELDMFLLALEKSISELS